MTKYDEDLSTSTRQKEEVVTQIIVCTVAAKRRSGKNVTIILEQ